MKKSKKLLICISSFIVILVVIYYYRPIKISQIIQNNNTMLQIIHVRGTEDVSNPDITSENYIIDSDSSEIELIYNILSDYYYHSSVDTLIKDTNTNDSGDMLAIKNDKHTIMITDNYKIMIDGIPYKIGYISNKKSKELINEILSVIKID